jgi:uncharacterized protein
VTPTRKQCLDLISRYQMLPHILRHSELVTRVALFIAAKLNQEGQHLDLALIEAGALLHDIAKTMCLTTKENHATVGGALLITLGYPAVAGIVRQHIRLDQKAFDPLMVTEEELVNYADKRVKHEEVVDLTERFRDIQERYTGKFPGLEEAMAQVFDETLLIEKKILSLIDMTPEQIVQSLFQD